MLLLKLRIIVLGAQPFPEVDISVFSVEKDSDVNILFVADATTIEKSPQEDIVYVLVVCNRNTNVGSDRFYGSHEVMSKLVYR